MEHIDLAQSADLILVAPATANVLGKVAAGIADDLLSTVVMATRAPVVFAPAMNNQMWTNPVVQGNVARLKRLGYHFVGPEAGALACGTEGPGRLAAVEAISARVWSLLDNRKRELVLAGRTVIVTTGRTEEEIDPVRVITNRSSGRMGLALARAARDAGAQVQLVAGKTSLPIPDEFQPTRVTSTDELGAAVKRLLPRADVLFMAAALADFQPKTRTQDKRKDPSLSLELVRTPDILSELGRTRHRAKLIGFSLENRDIVARARAKLVQKRLDLIVANPVRTLDRDDVQATLVFRTGRTERLPRMSKDALAARLMPEAARLLPRRQGRKRRRNR